LSSVLRQFYYKKDKLREGKELEDFCQILEVFLDGRLDEAVFIGWKGLEVLHE